jgi:hypothetical protein
MAGQQGDIIGMAGAYTLAWENLGMTQLESMRVASLADEVTMELQAFFRRDS